MKKLDAESLGSSDLNLLLVFLLFLGNLSLNLLLGLFFNDAGFSMPHETQLKLILVSRLSRTVSVFRIVRHLLEVLIRDSI